MTYQQLLARVKRAIGLHPGYSGDLRDCLREMRGIYNNNSYAIVASIVVHELAEYTEDVRRRMT